MFSLMIKLLILLTWLRIRCACCLAACDFEKYVLAVNSCPDPSQVKMEKVEKKFDELGVIKMAVGGLKGFVPGFATINLLVNSYAIVDGIVTAGATSEAPWQEALNAQYTALISCMNIKFNDYRNMAEEKSWTDLEAAYKLATVKLQSTDPATKQSGINTVSTLFNSNDNRISEWSKLTQTNGHYYYSMFPAFKLAIQTKWWLASTHLSYLRSDPHKLVLFNTDFGTTVADFNKLKAWAHHAYTVMSNWYYPTGIRCHRHDKTSKTKMFGEWDYECVIKESVAYTCPALGTGEHYCYLDTCKDVTDPTNAYTWGEECNFDTCTSNCNSPPGMTNLKQTADNWFVELAKWTKLVDSMVQELSDIETTNTNYCGMKQISTATDGTTFGIDSVGHKLYRRDGNAWTHIPTCFKYKTIDISVASSTLIYALDQNGMVYENKNNGNNVWTEVINNIAMIKISVATDDTMYGIASGTDKKLYRRDGINNNWQEISSSFDDISVASSTYYAGIKTDGNLWINENSVNTNLGKSPDSSNWKQISVAADGTMFALNINNMVYRRGGTGAWEYQWNFFSDISIASSTSWYGVAIYGDMFKSVNNGQDTTALGRLTALTCPAKSCTNSYKYAKGKYIQMNNDYNGCPTSSKITSVEECRSAHDVLGLRRDDEWLGSSPAIPTGCLWRDTTTANLGFNSAPTGAGRSDAYPICLRSSKYIMLPVRSNGCQGDKKITSVEECRVAHDALGLRRNDEWLGSSTDIPTGCLWRDTTTANLGFNSASTGAGRSDAYPICLGPTYVMLPTGSHGCPIGQDIETLAECRVAHDALGLKRNDEWLGNSPAIPTGCLWRDTVTANLGFNSAPSGAGRSDAYPICVMPSSYGYIMLSIGSNGCAPGTQITSVEECRIAHDALGLRRNNEWLGSVTDIPAGCIYRHALTGNLHFNSASTGEGRGDLYPICSNFVSGYIKLSIGSNGCASGNQITSVEECRVAHDALGLRRNDEWLGSSTGIPAGCIYRAETTANLHFNSATTGAGRADLYPICRAPRTTSIAPPPTSSYASASVKYPNIIPNPPNYPNVHSNVNINVWIFFIGCLLALILTFNTCFICYKNGSMGTKRISYSTVKSKDSEFDSEAQMLN